MGKAGCLSEVAQLMVSSLALTSAVGGNESACVQLTPSWRARNKGELWTAVMLCAL